jgi:hypothetical protein
MASEDIRDSPNFGIGLWIVADLRRASVRFLGFAEYQIENLGKCWLAGDYECGWQAERLRSRADVSGIRGRRASACGDSDSDDGKTRSQRYTPQRPRSD